jgi:hypothetical protein
MAGSFDGSTSKLQTSSAPATGTPVSMACWINPNNITNHMTLVSLANSGTTTDLLRLTLRGDVGGDPVWAHALSNSVNDAAATSSGFSSGTWQHACAVFAAANDRRVYLNGGSKGTNATSVTPSGINRLTIGSHGLSTDGNFTAGKIAEVAIWDGVALTDADVATLATGITPSEVQAEHLIFYAPMIRDLIDTWGGFALTATAVTVADHPRIYRPRRALWVPSAPVAGPPAGSLALLGVGV